MAKREMKILTLCGVPAEKTALLAFLQKKGVVQLETVDQLPRPETGEAQAQLREALTQTRQALAILEKYAPAEKGLGAILSSPSVSKEESTDPLWAADILNLERERQERKSLAAKAAARIRQLEPWQELPVPSGFTGTAHVACFLGTVLGQPEEEEIRSRLTGPSECFILNREKHTSRIALLCLQIQRKEAEEALKELRFAPIPQGTEETPKAEMGRQTDMLFQLHQEIRERETYLADLSKRRDSLRRLFDRQQAELLRRQAEEQLGQTERTFFLQGFLPADREKKLGEQVRRHFTVVWETRLPEPGEEVPVLLANAGPAASCQGVTEAFGLPLAEEKDPTSLMSVFYLVMFGLMLSDAGYGLLLVLLCGWLWRRYPKMDRGIKRTIALFFYGGISTAFWGVLFGSWFGDAVPVISRVFFDREIQAPALWFPPLSNPVRLLMFCFLLGLIHLFTGLGIQGVSLWRQKRYGDWFSQVFCWFALLLGLIFLFLPTELFASIAQFRPNLPSWAGTLAAASAIAGAAGILLTAGRDSQNWGLRIIRGLYGLYDITGWLSDVLSYSRLLALGLATGVIAQVVNAMGTMAGGGIRGALVFVPVFVLGHAFNLVINLFGAYVHSNRLEFVEFFGKFYQGGGKAFAPFDTKARYTGKEEEMLYE